MEKTTLYERKWFYWFRTFGGIASKFGRAFTSFMISDYFISVLSVHSPELVKTPIANVIFFLILWWGLYPLFYEILDIRFLRFKKMDKK